MDLKTLLFTENDCYKAQKYITPQGIMVHSTGANNPTLRRYIGPDDGLLGENKYKNHWNQPMDRKVCVHGFIGKLADGTPAVYQTLPWTMRGWHAGSGEKGSANNTHLGFEICEDGLQDKAYFEATYRLALELCAHLCREFHLDPMADGVVIDHREGHARGIASNHGDVAHWWGKFGKTMEDFRRELAQMVNLQQTAPEASPEAFPEADFGTVQAKEFDTARRGFYTVTAESGLRLRRKPGEDGDVLALLAKGTPVYATGGYEGPWRRVETAHSYVGFCHEDYLQEDSL